MDNIQEQKIIKLKEVPNLIKSSIRMIVSGNEENYGYINVVSCIKSGEF